MWLFGGFYNRHSGCARSWRIPVAVFSAFLTIAAGCRSLSGGSEGQVSDSGDGLNLSAPSSNPFRIDRALISKHSRTDLELISDLNQMTYYCSADQRSSVSGASECECVYRITRAGGAQETFTRDTRRVEGGMVRCPLDTLPGDTVTLALSLESSTQNLESNSVAVSLNASLSSGLDLSHPDAYRSVQRFQCNDRVRSLPFLLDSEFVDPFQSESPWLQHPLNFYTSNLGATPLQFSSASGSNAGAYASLDCAFTESELVDTPWHNFVLFSGAQSGVFVDPSNPSVQFEVSDWRISPHVNRPDNNFNRSSFTLARERAGVFSVPVLHKPIPFQYSSASSSLYPPLGYAARPRTISGQNRCPGPSEVTIPTGYRWVKLFAFRTSMDVRMRVSGSSDLQKTTSLVCDPGNRAPGSATASNQAVFPDCATRTGGGGTRHSPFGRTKDPSHAPATGRHDGSSDGFFGRALLIRENSRSDLHACLNISNDPSFVGASAATHPYPTGTPYPALGAQEWRRTGSYWEDTLSPAELSSFQSYAPFGVGTVAQGETSALTDSSLTLSALDPIPRNDFVFVVAPEWITLSDLASPTYQAFVPFRGLSHADCRRSGVYHSTHDLMDPSNPAPIDPRVECSSRVSYGPIEAQIPEVDGGLSPTPTYPLCVLQKEGV